MEIKHQLKFGSRQKYQIVVGGYLDSSWSSVLGDMEISVEQNSSGQKQSKLIGIIRDQAALSGILNAIHDMHLPVISVESLNEE